MRTLVVVAAVWIVMGLACSSGSSAKPPLLTLTPGQGGGCAPGNACPAATFCVAVEGSGCKYLECADAGTWTCVPDGGFELDSSAAPHDAGPQ